MRGFTLLEVMVVVVIIGIMMMTFTLSLRGDSHAKLLQREAQRMIALLDLASQEAVMRSEQLAVRFSDDSYEFMLLQNGRWLPVDGDRPLRTRQLPDDIELRLELEDNPPPSLVNEESDLPQVFLLSSGEITPFVVTLFSPNTERRFHITGNLLGRLELEE
ncbi:General secretion pathway protein G [hydrothermal vent metagenome]|uniref:Type II secretion system protein H n=1 Tax=hydrothermal vent metagenome TaxID=652676 RepID=A0A3B0YTB8_9ZZZZ